MSWDSTAPGATAQQKNARTSPQATRTDVVPSGARTASGSGGGNALLDGVTTLNLLLDVTAVSGTSPSLVVSVEWSHDGNTWFNPDPVDSLATVTAVSQRVKSFDVKAPQYRVVWVIAGTTPSFTFAVHTHAH